MNHEWTLKTALADIRKGVIAPCYLLYGNEDYLVGDALQQIVDLSLPEGDRSLSLVYMDGDHEDAGRLCEALRTPSLISGRKVVVLKNARLLYSSQSLPELINKIKESIDRDSSRAVRTFLVFLKMAGWSLDDFRDGQWKKISDEQWNQATGGDHGDREKWLPKIVDLCVNQGMELKSPLGGDEEISSVLLEGLPEGTCLILTADAVDKRKKLFKIIAEKGVVLGFNRVKGEGRQKTQMLDAAKNLLRSKGKAVSPETLLLLGEKTGFDLRRSMAELEKLIAYSGENAQIKSKDIEDIIGKTRADTVFDLTASLVEKDSTKALMTLHDLLDQGINHLAILAMIIREIRFLLHAKWLVLSGCLGAFNRRMDFAQFQRTVLPLLKEWSSATGNTLELAGQHPYVIYNALKFSDRFSREKLNSYLDDLLDVDLALKTTGQDPRLLMERLVIRLCTPG